MLHSMCQYAYKRCVLLKAVDLQASAADLSHEKGAHECFINSNGSVIPLAAKEKENIPLKWTPRHLIYVDYPQPF